MRVSAMDTCDMHSFVFLYFFFPVLKSLYVNFLCISVTLALKIMFFDSYFCIGEKWLSLDSLKFFFNFFLFKDIYIYIYIYLYTNSRKKIKFLTARSSN